MLNETSLSAKKSVLVVRFSWDKSDFPFTWKLAAAPECDVSLSLQHAVRDVYILRCSCFRIKRPGGGLGSVLGMISKKPKMGTLVRISLEARFHVNTSF